MKDYSYLNETRIDGEDIFDGKVVHLIRDRVSLPNGHEGVREVIRHVGAVCVIPIFENGDVLVERQFRYPHAEVLLEIPAGKLDSKSEDPRDAIIRELYEETGISREDIPLTHLMDFTYPLDPCYVEVYVGQLLRSVEVTGDENPLFWSDLDHDFFDMREYAGEGNIGHIMEHIKLN